MVTIKLICHGTPFRHWYQLFATIYFKHKPNMAKHRGSAQAKNSYLTVQSLGARVDDALNCVIPFSSRNKWNACKVHNRSCSMTSWMTTALFVVHIPHDVTVYDMFTLESTTTLTNGYSSEQGYCCRYSLPPLRVAAIRKRPYTSLYACVTCRMQH